MSEIAVPGFFSRHTEPFRERVDLIRFAEEASAARRIAQVLCQTSFVPDAYRNRPDEATAAILFGQELQVKPMHALQEIVVIQGRPSLSANAMRGVVQNAGGIFETLESSDEKVVVRAKMPHQQNWSVSKWDLDRARKYGLLNKDNWRKQPQAMLSARCTAEVCRLVASDVLIGLPYSTEEMHDVGAPDVAEPVAKTRTVRRRALPADFEAPQIDPVPPEPMITSGTRKTLMAVFGEANIHDRAARLKAIAGVIGHDVRSAMELTEAQAQDVITSVQEQIRLTKPDEDWPPVPEVGES